MNKFEEALEALENAEKKILDLRKTRIGDLYWHELTEDGNRLSNVADRIREILGELELSLLEKLK